MKLTARLADKISPAVGDSRPIALGRGDVVVVKRLPGAIRPRFLIVFELGPDERGRAAVIPCNIAIRGPQGQPWDINLTFNMEAAQSWLAIPFDGALEPITATGPYTVTISSAGLEPVVLRFDVRLAH